MRAQAEHLTTMWEHNQTMREHDQLMHELIINLKDKIIWLKDEIWVLSVENAELQASVQGELHKWVLPGMHTYFLTSFIFIDINNST